ncbi:MAG: type II restriction endonuclease [Candidatus Dojkabacteria bacterium]|nr:MAG: type II restriction endonuclease [Candidatus Dojkabacteria bacterium]
MLENNFAGQAIEAVKRGSVAFSKFITSNDAGVTGGHQSGFHLHKNSYPLFFETQGVKGENSEKFAKIKWQGDFETDSRFIYYGVGTRDEYRLTRFGKGFPFLTEESVGNLLILTKQTDEYYEAFVLSSDDEIETFFSAFGISPQETNKIIPKTNTVSVEDQLMKMFEAYIGTISVDFPLTTEIADNARKIIMQVSGISTIDVKSNPDKELLRWLDTEYKLFKTIENNRYSNIIGQPFKDVDSFIQTANSILNRRKSRAGKSLEHHLSNMFTTFDLKFSEQTVTEEHKKPDFIFPSPEAYHNFLFDQNKLVFLAAKTTCKDRWRQILNEADRIKVKHLFTLQQGISSNQMKEMTRYNVKLVVPKEYINTYPKEYREGIYSLGQFVRYVDATQK